MNGISSHTIATKEVLEKESKRITTTPTTKNANKNENDKTLEMNAFDANAVPSLHHKRRNNSFLFVSFFHFVIFSHLLSSSNGMRVKNAFLVWSFDINLVLKQQNEKKKKKER